LSLQNSRQMRLATFLLGIWFIIAGVLLPGPSTVLAESYTRVLKKGVVYYHFNNRPPPSPSQGVTNNSALGSFPPKPLKRPALPEGEALSQKPSPRRNLPPASVKGLIRVKSNSPPAAAPAKGSPGLKQLMPATAADLPVVNPDDVQENIWAGTRYLVALLTKLGCSLPPGLSAYGAAPQRLDHLKDVPPLQDQQAFAPKLGEDFPKYVQLPRPELAQKQFSDYLIESSPLHHRFPVSGPFSFKDSWGDMRGGGRQHRAVDIFAREGAEVYAITAGVIQTLATLPEAGIILLMRGQDGRGYGYMHLQGYAPGIVQGKTVRTGELIGYVGRTGIRQSAAHLHLQVYADHRLCKDELLNPYPFLVQLCHGIGVTDLSSHKIARLETPEIPEIKGSRIQVTRRPAFVALKERGSQRRIKNSSVLVIKNF